MVTFGVLENIFLIIWLLLIRKTQNWHKSLSKMQKLSKFHWNAFLRLKNKVPSVFSNFLQWYRPKWKSNGILLLQNFTENKNFAFLFHCIISCHFCCLSALPIRPKSSFPKIRESEIDLELSVKLYCDSQMAISECNVWDIYMVKQ